MMYSGDEYYGDEITSPIERPQLRKRISYRGVSAIWSSVYQAFVFTFRTAGQNQAYRATTESQFRWDVESLIERESR